MHFKVTDLKNRERFTKAKSKKAAAECFARYRKLKALGKIKAVEALSFENVTPELIIKE